MENISISVLVYFITSNQQRRFHFLCSLEGNTLMSDGLHRSREIHRCTSSGIKVNCNNQLSSSSSLGCVALVRAMAVAVALEGLTELAVLVQVCLCSLTTPPDSREMLSKQVRCLKRDNLATECVGPRLHLTFFHLSIKAKSSIKGLQYQAFTKYFCTFMAYFTANASLKRLWGLEGNMQCSVTFT